MEKKKYIYPPFFSNHSIPHHQRNNSLQNKKIPHLSTLRNNQTSPSHATKKQLLKLIPIRKNNHFSQSHLINYSLESGGIISSSPPHPIKTLLKKNEKKS
jgi:hypothetical protein